MRGKPVPTFSFDEVMAELQKIIVESEDGVFTVRDLKRRTGLGIAAVRSRVNMWFEMGWIEFVGHVKRRSMDQKMRPVPAYRWVGEKEKEGGDTE